MDFGFDLLVHILRFTRFKTVAIVRKTYYRLIKETKSVHNFPHNGKKRSQIHEEKLVQRSSELLHILRKINRKTQFLSSLNVEHF